MKRADDIPPRRLVDREGPARQALARFAQRTASGGDEPRAFVALQERLGRRPSRATAVGVFMGAVLVGAVGTVLLVRPPAPAPAPVAPAPAISRPAPVVVAPAISRPAPVVVAPAIPRPAAPVIPRAAAPATPRPAPMAVATPGPRRVLPAGESTITTGLKVRVFPESVAIAHLNELTLERGTVHVAVAPTARARMRVIAGPYTFVDIGTTFQVEWRAPHAELRVSEGAVAVYRDARRLAIVRDVWRSHAPSRAEAPEPPVVTAPIAAEPLPAPPPIPPPKPDVPSRSCAAHADVGAALSCYERQASGTGLGAETALYEIGRLRRDSRKDLAGALATFRESQRRFPRGALRREVGLSVVDLLPRLGRHREALDESARLLAEHPDLERADELRLLRGNLYRQALNDCARAVPEYERVPSIAEARLHRAECLARLGRRQEAIQAYQELARAGPHSETARARLKELTP